MSPIAHSLRALTLAAAMVAGMAGCSMNVPIAPQVTAERTTRIDRSVAVYIAEDTRTAKWSESRYGDTWNFPVGPASSGAIEDAARRTFRRATVVDGLPPLGPGAPDVDAVLEVRIEEFSFVIPFLKTSTYSAEITYRFTLYALTGAPVASWLVTGEGARQGQFGFEYTRWPGVAANLAIEDAMKAFVEEIDRDPEVAKWLRDSASGAPALKTGA